MKLRKAISIILIVISILEFAISIYSAWDYYNVPSPAFINAGMHFAIIVAIIGTITLLSGILLYRYNKKSK